MKAGIKNNWNITIQPKWTIAPMNWAQQKASSKFLEHWSKISKRSLKHEEKAMVCPSWDLSWECFQKWLKSLTDKLPEKKRGGGGYVLIKHQESTWSVFGNCEWGLRTSSITPGRFSFTFSYCSLKTMMLLCSRDPRHTRHCTLLQKHIPH